MNKQCLNCNRNAHYNLHGYTPIYCIDCKTDDMIYRPNIPCILCDKKQAIYSLYEELDPINCINCKHDNMVISKSVVYSKKQYKKRNCEMCKDSIIYAANKKFCVTCMLHFKCIECNTQLKYKKLSQNRITTTLNINKEIMCKKCLKCVGQDGLCYNNRSTNNKYGKYCVFCYINTFIIDEISYKSGRLTKEKKTINLIVNAIKDVKWIYNRPFYTNISGKGCCESKRRIDLWSLINNTILAIEIDENQHKKYIEIDEDARYNDLFMDFSGKYIFIRYNPDENNLELSYYDFKKRCDVLIKEITKQIKKINDGKNDDLIDIIHLYYD